MLKLAALSAATRGAAAEPPKSDGETIPLWPGTPPGGDGVHPVASTQMFGPMAFIKGVAVPTLTVYRPERPDGSAALVIPGGSYVGLTIDLEGTYVARRLNGNGITCFLLRYRLPCDGWADRSDVPLQDAQRAMRIIRSRAGSFGIDPQRLGVVGFSAGGHLSASLATRFAAQVYQRVDDVDGADARPAFAAMIYPVITMGEGTHAFSRDNLLGPNPSPEKIAAYSCEKHVTADVPPGFLCVGMNDGLVPPMANTFAMYKAYFAARVPAELHMFETGPHGFAMAPLPGHQGNQCAELFLHWGYAGGWFRDPSAAPA